MATASSRRPLSRLLDLDLTIVSAKHLKNVNWRNGELKPYAIFWVYPDRRLATKSDDSGSNHPVWNERFIIPIHQPFQDSILTVKVFHSRPSETPKPLVGALLIPLRDLLDSDDSNRVRNFQLNRPSGRPHGKIRLKIASRERPLPPPLDYHIIPPNSSYYTSAPPPPPSGRDDRRFPPLPTPYAASVPSSTLSPPQPPYPGCMRSDPYAGYYSGYYPPPPPRPFFNRPSNYGLPPSAPVDYSLLYDSNSKPKGLATGAVVGAFGGLALEEGFEYEQQEKMGKRVESDVAARDDYSDYGSNY